MSEATPAQRASGPPGALAEPTEGQAAAEDPLVSDAAEEAATGTAAAPSGPTRARPATVGTATFRPPVIEDGPAPDAPSGDVPPDAAGVLYAQLQELRQEVMELRGLVERQANLLSRLEREQRERYVDLDRRLSRAGAGAAAGAEGAVPATMPDGSATGAGGDEQAAYERAFGMTRDKRFEEAIPAFRQLIDTWPDGQYTPNAWYWLGELHLALPSPELEDARAAFVQVVQQWPEHGKVPDALYKLGVVHDRLGEPGQARDYLDRAVAEYPSTPAARLARSYLEQMQG